MNNLFKSSKFLLCFLLCILLTSSAYGKDNLKVFFGGIENKSTFDSPSFFANTAKKLKIAFTETGRFILTKNLDKATLILNSEVLEVKIGNKAENLKFSLRAVLVNKKNETVWEGISSIGNEKIGYDGKIENLFDEIAQKSCNKLAEQAAISLVFTANVQMISGKDIILDGGKDKGLSVNTIVQVINKNGKVVAKAKVSDVYLASSRAEILHKTSLENISVGDTVKIFSLPAQSITGKKSGKKNKFVKTALTTLGIVVGAAIIVASQKSKSSQPTTTTTTTTDTGLPITPAANITLTANPTSINADGSSLTTITAAVSDANKAAVADGTQVTFKTTNGTLIQTGGGATTTTTNGMATIQLMSSTTVETATVTATADTATDTATVNFVAVTSPPASINLSLDSNPVSIATSGANIGTANATLTATVLDANGNNVADGTSVTFTTDLGSITGLATTTSGVATVSFTSTKTGTATITATSNNISQTITLNVNPGPPYMLDVVANPTSIETNGNSFSEISVTVRDISGNLVTDGTKITFSITADKNAGGNGTITAISYTTSGIAKGILVTRDASNNIANSGTATIVAVAPTSQPTNIPAPATAITNSGTKVTFVSKDAVYVSVAPTNYNLRGLDRINNTTTITALVYDINHNPVADGTAVYFYADHGMIEGDGTTVNNVATSTTVSGIATATIATAGSNSEPGYNPATDLVNSPNGSWNWNGDVHISVVSGQASYNLDKSDTTMIFTGPTNVNNSIVMTSTGGVGLFTAPPNCGNLANKGDSCTITIIAHDINNKYIVDGTTVTFDTSKGTLTASSATTVGGTVSTTLKTAALTEDVPTASGPGKVTITIPSGSSSSVVVQIDFNVL